MARPLSRPLPIQAALTAAFLGLTPLSFGSHAQKILSAARWTDPAAHKSAFVRVNGIRMNYLDWGGSKPVLILIHGYQDNPHVFDDLAPAFTDHFRVIAYARRGHGDTEAKPPYDVATLTEDLRTLMDSLHIAKADLAGWSMGGDEITAMAGTHPDRVNRIVYLEGAYDWADPQMAAAFHATPGDMSPPASSLTSLDAFRDYQHASGFPRLADMSRVEAYVRDLVIVQPHGHLVMRLSDTASSAMLHTLTTERRDYTKIHAPTLAIYATTFLEGQYGDAAQRAKTQEWERNYMAPFRVSSMQRVKREIPGIETLQVPGTHMAFLFDSRDQVVAAMRRFLEGPTAQR
jgi:pimeloyl-ACP methyl ester carboxylesterase